MSRKERPRPISDPDHPRRQALRDLEAIREKAEQDTYTQEDRETLSRSIEQLKQLADRHRKAKERCNIDIQTIEFPTTGDRGLEYFIADLKKKEIEHEVEYHVYSEEILQEIIGILEQKLSNLPL